MSTPPRQKDDPGPSPAPPLRKSEELKDNAREKLALSHQAADRARRLIGQSKEILQHRQARRERQAEQATPQATTVPQAGVNILLIEDSPADVTLFRYALKECGLPCQLTVLTTGDEVKAFFTPATTTASLSLPRLIIADCLIPGMEAEDIVAAVRTVPAYHRVPIMLFSSLAEDEGQRRSEACGATLFVHKPNDLEAFMTAVSTMVQRWNGMSDRADVTPANSA